MKRNQKLDEFFKVLAKPKVVLPPPKFKVGDVIMNFKYKIVCKVVDIRNIYECEDGSIRYETATYVLEDIKNEAFDQYLAKEIQDAETRRHLMQQAHNNSRKRHKLYNLIDYSYVLVEPKTAQILYGVNKKD